jgi:hypothetical protein
VQRGDNTWDGGSPEVPSANKRTKTYMEEFVSSHMYIVNCSYDPGTSDKVNKIAWSLVPNSYTNVYDGVSC